MLVRIRKVVDENALWRMPGGDKRGILTLSSSVLCADHSTVPMRITLMDCIILNKNNREAE